MRWKRFWGPLFAPKNRADAASPGCIWLALSRLRMDLDGASRQHEFGYQWQMVGETGPVMAAARVPVRVLGHELAGAVQAACVDVVQLRQGQARGEGGAAGGVAQAGLGQDGLQFLAPVVEVARNQQGRAGGHLACDELLQLARLAHAAGAEQAQVNNDDVDVAALHVNDRVQQAALLEAVV